MSLWVVNQEGDLCQVIRILNPKKTIKIHDYKLAPKDILEKGYELIGYGVDGEALSLGYYATEERIFKIFEEIIDFLCDKEESRFRITTDLLEKIDGKTIYKMPKE